MFQIPSILNHHKVFLEELRKKLDTWELKQTIGDVFLDVVRFTIKHPVVLFNENIHLSFHFLQLKLLSIRVPFFLSICHKSLSQAMKCRISIKIIPLIVR